MKFQSPDIQNDCTESAAQGIIIMRMRIGNPSEARRAAETMALAEKRMLEITGAVETVKQVVLCPACGNHVRTSKLSLCNKCTCCGKVFAGKSNYQLENRE